MAPALANHRPAPPTVTDEPQSSRPTDGGRRCGPRAPSTPAPDAVDAGCDSRRLKDLALSRSGRLLVVDDSPVERALAATILERAGFDVALATDGAEAVRMIRDAHPPFDAVVMDVSMPVVDGLAATRAIRALPDRRAEVPIIALTANTDDDDRARCLAAGMNAHTCKPLSLPLLMAAMHAHLRPV